MVFQLQKGKETPDSDLPSGRKTSWAGPRPNPSRGASGLVGQGATRGFKMKKRHEGHRPARAEGLEGDAAFALRDAGIAQEARREGGAAHTSRAPATPPSARGAPQRSQELVAFCGIVMYIMI